LAAFLGGDVNSQKLIRKLVVRTYQARSAIVHGDIRPTGAQLRRAVEVVNGLLRPTLRVFLATGGDQKVLGKLKDDLQLAERARSWLPFEPLGLSAPWPT
jgi:hypothetical protein